MTTAEWEVRHARVALGEVSPNSGIQFWVHLPPNITVDREARWHMDVSASSTMWNNLPFVASSLADLILPLSCRATISTSRKKGKEETVFWFTLGARRMGHSTLLKSLRDQVRGGDPPIRLEFLQPEGEQPDRVRFSVVFKCSRVLWALTNNDRDADVRFNGPVPHLPRRRGSVLGKLGALLGFLVGPIFWLLSCWSLWLGETSSFVQSILASVPTLVGRVWLAFPSPNNGLADVFDPAATTTSTASLLPAIPRSLRTAFRLGQILTEVQSNSGDRSLADQLLAEAGTLVDRDSQAPLSIAELAQMPNTLRDLELGRGILAYVLEFFTVVNIVWLISILVIAVSFAPAIYYTLGPLSRILKRLLLSLWRRVLRPLSLRLHNWGVFMSLAWLAAYTVLADCRRVPNSLQFFVGFTSLLLALLSTVYCTALFGIRFVKDWRPINQNRLIWSYCIATFIPFAFFSEWVYSLPAIILLHFLWWELPVFAFFDRLIGVELATPIRCSWMGLTLTCLHCALKILLHRAGMPDQLDLLGRQFGTAILWVGNVFGCAPVLFYAQKDVFVGRGYLFRNATLLAALAVVFALSFYTPNSLGLRSVGVIVSVLWAVQKYCDFHLFLKLNNWLLLLLLGCFGYWCALSLHSDPSLLINLFS